MNNMDTKKLLWVIAGVLLVTGVVLALVPVNVGTPTGAYTCGTVFGDNRSRDLGATLSGQPGTLLQQCTDKRGDRRTLVLVLAVPGLLLGLVSLGLAGFAPTAGREPQSPRR